MHNDAVSKYMPMVWREAGDEIDVQLVVTGSPIPIHVTDIVDVGEPHLSSMGLLHDTLKTRPDSAL